MADEGAGRATSFPGSSLSLSLAGLCSCDSQDVKPFSQLSSSNTQPNPWLCIAGMIDIAVANWKTPKLLHHQKCETPNHTPSLALSGPCKWDLAPWCCCIFTRVSGSDTSPTATYWECQETTTVQSKRTNVAILWSCHHCHTGLSCIGPIQNLSAAAVLWSSKMDNGENLRLWWCRARNHLFHVVASGYVPSLFSIPAKDTVVTQRKRGDTLFEWWAVKWPSCVRFNFVLESYAIYQYQYLNVQETPPDLSRRQ